MRIENILTIGDPKSVIFNHDYIKTTGESRLLPDDILIALGVTQSREGLGLHLLYAKYKKDQQEKAKAHKRLYQIAAQQAPKAMIKLAGRSTARVIELLSLLAIDDYCRTADSPGAMCRCGGRGKVYDIAATREQGRPIEKTCNRCNGLGIRRLPASKAWRVVATLLPNLTQQTWSRSWKPFYESLVEHCYREESAAMACLSAITKAV